MRVLVVDKPLGVSSHDVVARARRLLGTRRVGHAGTLDPLASGVLVLLVDEGTKLAPFLSGAEKRYLAWVAFGIGTPTLDAEGPIDQRGDASRLEPESVRAALRPFLELREQRPPAYSAVQQQGERAYAAARRGEALDLPPRPARYHALELLAWLPAGAPPATALRRGATGWEAGLDRRGGTTDGDAASHVADGLAAEARPLTLPAQLAPAPIALMRVTVAAGTYVRALARDLGAALGVPAHLAGLVRTGAGHADLTQAVALEAVADATPLDPLALLPFPRVELDAHLVREVRDGKRPTAPWEAGRATLVDAAGRLVAIADAVAGRVHTVRVWRSADGA